MELLEGNGILSVFQAVIGLSVLRVWLLNFNKPTKWRAGNAISMREEFEVYGLPDWTLYMVGFLKVAFSVGLLAGIWLPELVVTSAAGIAFFMFFAILKPRDHQNRTQHVLKPPGKYPQGLGDHLESNYIQKSTFGIFVIKVFWKFPLYK